MRTGLRGPSNNTANVTLGVTTSGISTANGMFLSTKQGIEYRGERRESRRSAGAESPFTDGAHRDDNELIPLLQTSLTLRITSSF